MATTTLDYHTIAFEFPLDDVGQHIAVFAQYRREVNEALEVEILDTEKDFLGMIINFSSHPLRYSIEGEQDAVLPKGSYNFFFIPKGINHWTLQPGINSIVYIRCDEGFLEQFIPELPLLKDFLSDAAAAKSSHLVEKHLPMPPEALDSMMAMTRSQISTSIARKTFLRAKLNNIIAVGLQHTASVRTRHTETEEVAELHRLYQYIANNLQFLKDTTTLPQQVNMSERQVRKKFKQHFGVSINDALLYERAKKAEELLLTTSIPVNDVGRRVGYRNQSAFSKAFYRRHGISPTDYRQRADKSNESA